jgi:hypothetical protein
MNICVHYAYLLDIPEEHELKVFELWMQDPEREFEMEEGDLEVSSGGDDMPLFDDFAPAPELPDEASSRTPELEMEDYNDGDLEQPRLRDGLNLDLELQEPFDNYQDSNGITPVMCLSGLNPYFTQALHSPTSTGAAKGLEEEAQFVGAEENKKSNKKKYTSSSEPNNAQILQPKRHFRTSYAGMMLEVDDDDDENYLLKSPSPVRIDIPTSPTHTQSAFSFEIPPHRPQTSTPDLDPSQETKKWLGAFGI